MHGSLARRVFDLFIDNYNIEFRPYISSKCPKIILYDPNVQKR